MIAPKTKWLVSAAFLPLLAAGTAFDSWGPSMRVGSWQLERNKDMTCASGKFAIGIQVKSGWYIHKFQLECAALSSTGQPTAIELSSPVGGDVGGLPHQSRCPSGKVLVGFKGRAFTWVDRIQIGCRSWSADGATGSVSWLPLVGGDGGQAYGPLTCPGAMAVNRVYGYGGYNFVTTQDLVMGYEFYCRSK